MYWCTKYGLQHDINSFALRRSWGGHENAKMVFAELNCHVLFIGIFLEDAAQLKIATSEL